MAEKIDNKKIRVWDLPVRLFHWTLVVLLAVSYFTGRAGGDWMKFHFWSGYAILTLLLFRIAWGFVGSTTARFSHFVRGPVAAIEHLKELAKLSAEWRELATKEVAQLNRQAALLDLPTIYVPPEPEVGKK